MNELLEKLKKTQTIFDLIVELYLTVDTSESPLWIKNYAENLKNGRYECALYQSIAQLIDELLDNSITFDSFKKELFIYLSDTSPQEFAVWMLVYFDQIFGEYDQYPLLKQHSRLSGCKLGTMGPLNTLQKDHLLYYQPVKGFASYSPSLQKIRGAKLQDLSKITSLFEHYTIISRITDEPVLVVKRYYNEQFRDCFSNPDTPLRIAVVPFKKDPWFQIRQWETPARNYFEIHTDVSLHEKINTAYLKVLETLSQKNVDIVIFPELAMNPSTKEVICTWLARQQFCNPAFCIKLVFLGSCWNPKDKTNICTLLSSTGNTILENHKKIGFIYRDKKTGKEYYEDLSVRPLQLEAVDLDYIGRLIYLVCRDALEDLDQAFLWNHHQIHMEVISSYSESLSHFENKMRYFSQTHKGISVLANCCAPRYSKDSIGFLSVPATDLTTANHNADGHLLHHSISQHCPGHCDICDCSHIYTLYPLQEKTYDGHQTIRMEQEFF